MDTLNNCFRGVVVLQDPCQTETDRRQGYQAYINSLPFVDGQTLEDVVNANNNNIAKVQDKIETRAYFRLRQAFFQEVSKRYRLNYSNKTASSGGFDNTIPISLIDYQGAAVFEFELGRYEKLKIESVVASGNEVPYFVILGDAFNALGTFYYNRNQTQNVPNHYGIYTDSWVPLGLPPGNEGQEPQMFQAGSERRFNLYIRPGTTRTGGNPDLRPANYAKCSVCNNCSTVDLDGQPSIDPCPFVLNYKIECDIDLVICERSSSLQWLYLLCFGYELMNELMMSTNLRRSTVDTDQIVAGQKMYESMIKDELRVVASQINLEGCDCFEYNPIVRRKTNI